MTTCNGCGCCCDPVTLPYNQQELRLGQTPYDVTEDERRWVLDDLVPMSRRVAKTKAPWYFGQAVMGANPGEDMAFFYSCRNFDAETRQCRIYDDRPFACRHYPWYGGDPQPGAALPHPCSFREDIGQTVVPLELIPKPL